MANDITAPLMQHALDVGQMFIDNACMKNAITPTPRRYAVEQTVDPAPVPPAAVPPTTVPTIPPLTSVAPGWDRTKAALLATTTALAGGLGGLGLANYFAQPVDPPPATNVNVTAPATGSLLQYLQDHGYHLPPGERK